MKHDILIAALCGVLLLTGCGSQESDSPEPTDSPSAEPTVSQETPAPETSEPEPEIDEEEEGDSETFSLDVTHVSYGDDIDWGDMEIEHGGNSMNIPDGWITIDGAEYGLVNGAYFIPPEGAGDNFMFNSHVAIEIQEGGMFGEADYSLKDVQQDVFLTMTARDYARMSGITDLEYAVWDIDGTYVFIFDFLRSGDTLTMYQTNYYILEPDRTIVVYASTFDGIPTIDAEIPVQEAACHLIRSLVAN